MNKLVDIKQQSTNNDWNEPTEALTTVESDVWCQIQPIKGREYFRAGDEGSDVTHRITMRYRSNVAANMVLVYGTREFDIESVINLEEADLFLEIMAVERDIH